MELVIDIDDEIYEVLKNDEIMVSGMRSGKTFVSKLCMAVANGTPLSKRHGRIGDLDKLDNRLKRMQSRHADPLDVTGNAIACGIALARSMIGNAPAIIEAGKEG